MLRSITVVIALAIAATSCGAGPRDTHPAAPTLAESEDSDYHELLQRYVDDDGRVDYARWKESSEDVAALERYVSFLLGSPPNERPELYPHAMAKLSYWLNLYNALVLREVIHRWPLASVQDVPPLSGSFRGAGRGFFHDLVFDVGAERMSLLDIETKVIRTRFQDARVHLALSCGSRSCALLPKRPFDAAVLDVQLDRSARGFVNDPRNVKVHEDDRSVELSPVLGWYRADFEDFVASRTTHPAPSLIDFLLMYAEEDLAKQLKHAADGRFRVRYAKYDWSVNAPSAASEAPSQSSASSLGVGTQLPDFELTLLDGSTWRPSDARGKVVLLDFWATWCRPCLVSFPKYTELQLAHERRGLLVVAVAQDDSDEPVRRFVKQNRVGFSIALDAAHRAAEPPLSVSTLPTEILIDREGIVRYRQEGYREEEVDALDKRVEALLQEGGRAPDVADDGKATGAPRR
jgi:peroxiredoxin